MRRGCQCAGTGDNLEIGSRCQRRRGGNVGSPNTVSLLEGRQAPRKQSPLFLACVDVAPMCGTGGEDREEMNRKRMLDETCCLHTWTMKKAKQNTHFTRVLSRVGEAGV